MELLSIGSKGPNVELLQLALNKAGYTVKIDGIFGTDTNRAVKNFQRSYSLNNDGIVGPKTWDALAPFFRTNTKNIVFTTISYTSNFLYMNLSSLKNSFPFLEIGSIGYSVLGKNIPYIKIGNGSKEVLYSASFHANEWITSVLLMKFVEDYSRAVSLGNTIWGFDARTLFKRVSIFIVPMVNPDGVDLVTGAIKTNSSVYNKAKRISNSFPAIPFVDGWKANINGVDLNLQFPAEWNRAKEIKFSQGFNKPAPRDYVGLRTSHRARSLGYL